MSQSLSVGSGRPINLVASPGATIHESVVGKVDKVTLVVSNVDASAHVLTFDMGPDGNPSGNQMEISIAANTIVEIPEFPVTNADVLTAFADAGDVLRVVGLVERSG